MTFPIFINNHYKDAPDHMWCEKHGDEHLVEITPEIEYQGTIYKVSDKRPFMACRECTIDMPDDEYEKQLTIWTTLPLQRWLVDDSYIHADAFEYIGEVEDEDDSQAGLADFV